MTVELLVNIDVDDLARASAFYMTVFALAPGRRFGDRGIELLGGSSRLYLLVKPAGSPAALAAAQPRDYRRHWTPVHLDFGVPDIEPPSAERSRPARSRKPGSSSMTGAASPSSPTRSATAFA